ncbi:helix-turn-helix domain-containing protein [Rhodococcoides kyotonense]|uniref:helix-turn-helix domain-containing protein n=1 Tax=Rhodococcoides kyotonense TaxID=398843 RepID=UPI00113206C5|nr:helix-turn-helix transcriptional regulator [Rhodococcus kyotonensis]
MTTQLELVRGSGESRSEAVARRLRGQIAEQRLTVMSVAKATGIARSTLMRKLDGDSAPKPFDIDELDRLAAVLDLRMAWLTDGEGNARNPHPDGPDGGFTVRPKGFEPLTS